MSKGNVKFDVKPVLECQMPYLIKLLHRGHFSWKDVNKSLKERHLAQNKNQSEGDIIDVNFLSLVAAFIGGKKEAFGMFDFYNAIFEQLFNRLSDRAVSYTHLTLPTKA